MQTARGDEVGFQPRTGRRRPTVDQLLQPSDTNRSREPGRKARRRRGENNTDSGDTATDTNCSWEPGRKARRRRGEQDTDGGHTTTATKAYQANNPCDTSQLTGQIAGQNPSTNNTQHPSVDTTHTKQPRKQYGNWPTKVQGPPVLFG